MTSAPKVNVTIEEGSPAPLGGAARQWSRRRSTIPSRHTITAPPGSLLMKTGEGGGGRSRRLSNVGLLKMATDGGGRQSSNVGMLNVEGGSKLLLEERKSSVSSLGGFAERRGRRQSMFARPNAPLLFKRQVTCIPLIIRFRRMAKLVRILCRVFSICKRDLNFTVPDNNWVALKEALLRESDVQLKDEEKKKKADSDIKSEVDQLKQTFDLNKFRRAAKSREAMIPAKMRDMMRKNPRLRTPDENANIRRMMQKYEFFSRYPIDVQRSFASSGWLEEFDPNRVVLLKGHAPSCFYFVLSGRLVSNEGDVTCMLKTGDKFGEEEIVTGDLRPATVISQDKTELFAVHKKDYRDTMKKIGVKDAMSLEICRNNPVFNHWPLEKLKENPYSWNVQNYKEGTLVVEDSSQCEWVYIIKSGKCKVIKCIRPRRSNEDDPDALRRLLAREAREKLMGRMSSARSPSRRAASSRGERHLLSSATSSRHQIENNKTFFTSQSRPQTCSTTVTGGRASSAWSSRRSRPTSAFLSSMHGEQMDRSAYVALEVLGQGDSFGFRTILPTEQRGPSVSLVSCGAEIIQINRKFFRRFADETTCSLVEMRFPPFPKREAIMRRLLQLHRWDDYKRQTIDQIQAHHAVAAVSPS